MTKKRMGLGVLVVVVGVLVLPGCRNAAAFNADRLSELRTRAAFDFQCPDGSLAYAPLAYGWSGASEDIVTSYGVEGCGNRAVFLLHPTSSQWVADSAGGADSRGSGGAPTPLSSTASAPPPASVPVVSLGPGFAPDPHITTGSAGGPLDASTLSSECRGYVSSAPSFVLTASVGFAMLRVIVSSHADTTLVIQRADGSFVCNDDFEGLNPGIQASFGPGQHRVWVGTYHAGQVGSPYTIGFTQRTTISAASIGGGGSATPSGVAGGMATALIPHQCGMSVASYGPVTPGSSVVLGRHTPWTGPDGEGGTVTDDDNWASDMSQWVGQRTTVTSHQGLDQAGCPVVHVTADSEQFYWRIRDMVF